MVTDPFTRAFFSFQFDSVATVVSVSEFATPSAFLSMAVVEACLKRIKKEQNDVDDEDHTDSDDDDDDDGARDLEKEVRTN